MRKAHDFDRGRHTRYDGRAPAIAHRLDLLVPMVFQMADREKKPSNFMEIVRIRRSVRRYDDIPVGRETIDFLSDVAQKGAEAFGFRSPLLLFVIDPGTRQRLSRAIFSGWFGKVNPWVLTTKAPGFVVACGHPERVSAIGDRQRYLAEAAIVMELVVLAAAEVGLSTCWLGGFGEVAVKKTLGLGEDVRIVAVSPLGYAPEKIRVGSWDYMVNSLVSKRRVSIEKIAVFVR